MVERGAMIARPSGLTRLPSGNGKADGFAYLQRPAKPILMRA
jgi:hypothetical protein